MDGYASLLITTGRSPGTVAHQQGVLRRFARWAGPQLDAVKVTDRTVREYMPERAVSEEVRRKEAYTIRAALRWARGEPAPAPRYRGPVGIRKVQGSLTPQEEAALLRARLPVKYMLVVRLGLHSGLRASEIASLPDNPVPETLLVESKKRMRWAVISQEAVQLSAACRAQVRPREERKPGATLLLTRDRRKDALLQQNGYFVLRFLTEDVGKHLDQILDVILAALVHREKSKRL